jgi:magnesium chelatase family protein
LRSPGRLTSAAARDAVLAARERQSARGGREAATNARLEVALLRQYARLDERGERVLEDAHRRGALSARGHDRVLRVARTIADLAGSERVRPEHLLKSLSLRHEVGAAPERVA